MYATGHDPEKVKPVQGQKYFTMLIGYPAMKRALKKKGWVEIGGGKKCKDIAGYTSSPNGKVASSSKHVLSREWETCLDLKFALSSADLQYHVLKKGCLINHNRGEGNLTCKSGLAENLHRAFYFNANWYPMVNCDPNGVGADAFFPRNHVVNSSEQLYAFQRDYIFTEAESYIKKFLKGYAK